VMRTSCFSGLLGAVIHNANRQVERLRLFEMGLRFRLVGGELAQEQVVAGAVMGSAQPLGWDGETRPVDFFDVKGDLEALFALSGDASQFSFKACERPGLHPGQTAAVMLGDRVIGHLGALHPRLVSAHKLPGTVYLFEIERDALASGSVPVFAAMSKFPAVRRDLSIIVDEAVEMAAVKSVVEQVGPDVLKNFGLFDVYRGEGIDSGRKSFSIGLTFQANSRTLNDDEIDAAVSDVVDGLRAHVGAVLRG
ncbi:MAG: phenylalanine--tRNA ligase subunit beta, partial [Gammaproteobacteria bacterium]